MTKVQLRFRLLKPLDETMMAGIASAHTIYGIFRVQVAPSQDALIVDYDATRLRREEVESALAGAGIPLQFQPA